MSLIYRLSDIMVGGFHENTVSRQVLSSSVPYYQDDLTWCVAPAGLASNITNVFGIFNLLTWFVTIFGIILTGLCILAYSRMEEKQNSENVTWSIMMALSFTLSQSSHFFPNRLTVKLFLLVVIFYGMHFNVAYHSFLITVLTRPRYESQIATTDTAVQAGLAFSGNEDTFEYFTRKGNDSVSQMLLGIFSIGNVSSKLNFRSLKLFYEIFISVKIPMSVCLIWNMIDSLQSLSLDVKQKIIHLYRRRKCIVSNE